MRAWLNLVGDTTGRCGVTSPVVVLFLNLLHYVDLLSLLGKITEKISMTEIAF